MGRAHQGAAAGASLTSVGVILRGHVSTWWIIRGPFAFRPATIRPTAAVHVLSTFGQIVLFWGFFLVVMPFGIAFLEQRWAVALPFPSVAGPVGVGVLVIVHSWLVIAYAVVGSLVWNFVVRPLEEADLLDRFGDDFERYRGAVRCWVPRVPKAPRSPSLL